MSAQSEGFPERTVEVEASTAPPPREVCCYDFEFAFRYAYAAGPSPLLRLFSRLGQSGLLRKRS
jgi:hypothetical protein